MRGRGIGLGSLVAGVMRERHMSPKRVTDRSTEHEEHEGSEIADGTNYRVKDEPGPEIADGSNYRGEDADDSELADGSNYRDQEDPASTIADGSNYRENP